MDLSILTTGTVLPQLSCVGNCAQPQRAVSLDFTGEGYEWWELRYSTLSATTGGRHIITGVLQNIQDIKDHEEELIRARRLAEHAELKQSFLNNMSHEIRTPLNAIAGFANLLVYDPELSGAEKQEYAGIINTNTKLLLKLVDDVLQLSRMETANMSFDLRRRVFIICSKRFTRHIVC